MLKVARYRMEIKLGLKKIRFKPYVFQARDDFFPLSNLNHEINFHLPELELNSLIKEANDILSGKFKYYSYHTNHIGNPPDWFLNPFNGKHAPGIEKHWSEIKAFGEVGDIKNVWEPSRFDWVYTVCRAYIFTKDKKYIDGLNELLRDWHHKNPLNLGVNWYCGQEASIRLFALLNCSLLLGIERKPSTALIESILAHLKRIYPNISYALAQDNNHGTSETAALYIGGNWLFANGRNQLERNFGKKLARIGKNKLESTVSKLFDSDGTFAQYSVNYHRVALDTLSFAELWRRKFDLSPFSQSFYKKAKAASKWLRKFTDSISGKGLNIGSNDGAMLLRTHSCDYRDFRPSCQLSAVLFEKELYFDKNGLWNEPLHLFKIKDLPSIESQGLEKTNEVLENNYLMFAARDAWACMRLPGFKFRPKQMDVFHFDFSYKGMNLLCDAGSYTYNPRGLDIKRSFKSTKAHNTVYFGNEQMPQLGTFLTGKWLSVKELSEMECLENDVYKRSAAYTDHLGNYHKRQITWSSEKWIIEDEIIPVSKDFIPELNFNLHALNISIDQKKNKITIAGSGIVLLFSVPVSIAKSDVSDYYMEKHEIYSINAKFPDSMQIRTEIQIS